MRANSIKTIGIAVVIIAAALRLHAQNGAYYTGVYRNMFKEHLNKTDQEVRSKINSVWTHFFVTEATKVYYEVAGTDMAYIYDTGNQDVRTEGMSYGLMICVQLDKQAEFDKIWKWSKKYMQYQSGDWNGYFAWQCNTNGTIKGTSNASDGEAYFITALFFAAHRWGNTTGIDYAAEAQNILNKVMSKTGSGNVYNLFDASSKLITFVSYGDSRLITDPSYNLPGFFKLWAEWSNTNKAFWEQTVPAARTLLKNSCHPTTGLFPDYSTFAGQPTTTSFASYDAKRYQYDAIRCALNVGMDFQWFGDDATNQTAMMTRLLNFFKSKNYANGYYDWDGGNPSGSYSEGMHGANGVGAFAVTDADLAKTYVQRLWDATPPSGQWRYYNGMVYFLSMLNVSGDFKIWKPIPNGMPQVKITAPAAGSSVLTPANITIEATATDSDGSIAKVEFFNGATPLCEDLTAPYQCQIANASPGAYNITVKATDNDNNASEASVSFSVKDPAASGTIVIHAQGLAGSESINLEIDGTIVETWTLTTDFADYTATTDLNGIIRVNYTNDASGLDVTLDYITVDGTIYQAEDQAINTSYYTNSKCGGGGNSELMHCSGYIEFTTASVKDNCPNDPNKTEPGVCGCGVPDTDTDTDGSLDCEDLDDDGDGVLDVDDCQPLNKLVGAKTTYYADADGDGKGDPNVSIKSCSMPANYVTDRSDLCPNDINKTSPGQCGCGVVDGTCAPANVLLKKGWNLIGCPTEGSTPLASALASVWSHVLTVKNPVGFYDKSVNPAMNSISTLDWGWGYMVKVDADCEIVWP